MGPISLVPLFWSLCSVKGPSIWRKAALNGPFAQIRDQSRGTKLEGPSMGERKAGSGAQTGGAAQGDLGAEGAGGAVEKQAAVAGEGGVRER